MEKAYIGVDVGGMSVKGGIVTKDGKIVHKEVVKTDCRNGATLFLKDTKNLLVSLINFAHNNGYEIDGIGFGIPGVVNNKLGIIDYATNLHFNDVHLKEYLNDLNIPIYLTNDANAAALAEQKFGAGKNYKDVVFVTLGTGIGGGIVIDNKLFEGYEGRGGEIGHMVIVVNGDQCNCGRKGCFERYASATALLKFTKEAMLNDKDSLMLEYCHNDINNVDGSTSFECAKKGDKTANEVIDKYIMYLGEGLLNICNIFRPQAIILGGGVSNQGDYLKNKVEKYLKDNHYGYKATPKVDVLIATLKNDSGIIGAASIAFK